MNKICTVTTIKAPLNQTLSFVNYHLNIGIDNMFLFFDNPDDEAINALSNYENVTCFRCDERYWNTLILHKDFSRLLKKMRQGGVLNDSKYLAKRKSYSDLARVEKQEINSVIALKIAREEKYKWILHIDSDELIYTKMSLKDLLSTIPDNIDVIRFPTLEAVPEKMYYDNFFKEVTLFKRNFWRFSKLFFNGHIAGKSIVRVDSEVKSLGVHRPLQNLKTKVLWVRGRLLHYDCCGYNIWRRNWLRRYNGTVIATSMGRLRVKLFNDFVETYENGDECDLIKLYKKQYFIPDSTKKRLGWIGWVKRINKNGK